MSAARRFLVLDDDFDSCYLNRRALEKAFAGCEVIEATTCNEAIARASRGKFDAFLADHHLRGETGASCIARLRALGVSCPILMVTGSEDPKIHTAAYAAGATHVCSPHGTDFVRCLQSVLGAAGPTKA